LFGCSIYCLFVTVHHFLAKLPCIHVYNIHMCVYLFALKKARKSPQVHQNLQFQADTQNIVFCPKKGPEFTSSSSKPPVSGGQSKYRFSPEKGPKKHLKFIKTYGFRRTLKISFFAQKRAPNSPQVHRNLRFQADIQNIVFRPKKSPENTSSSSKPPVSGGHSKYRFSPEKGLRNQFKFIKTTGFQADTQNIVFSPKRGPEIRSSLSKPQVPTTLF